ncbi:alkaline phosphatase family protein [Mycolicibacterium sp. XJ1819]
MGYAKYIGRVGALAVTLGVGAAMATSPGVAFAQDTDSSGTTTSTDGVTTTDTSTTPGGGDAGEGLGSPSALTEDGAELADDPEGEDVPPGDEGELGELDELGGDDEVVDEDLNEDLFPGADGDATGGGNTVASQINQHDTGEQDLKTVEQDGSDGVEPTGTEGLELTSTVDEEPELSGAGAADDGTARLLSEDTTADALSFTTTVAPEAEVPVVAQPRPTLISLVSDLVAAVLQPLISLGTGVPMQTPLLWTMLAATRNELQGLSRNTSPAAARYTVSQLNGPALNNVDATPHVLVIGVDGTNLSRILADDYNQNFFTLMNGSTTAASSIVGHTTISNPSWSAILTGQWGEKTGVINNVFTPWTYDKWPTVFNQLETHNPNIATTSIANWDVISAISGAGSIPADRIVFIPQEANDPNWLGTDDAVGLATVDAINGTAAGVPSFMFTYFVGVDENGHMYGGASEEYKLAIRNVDDNLGEIMDAIAEREKCNPGLCEAWTVIVVTDHGHQPQKGFGHGFQSPDETETFVIARGPNFQDGYLNLKYEIVDTTPTVVTLLGGQVPTGSDGVPLMSLSEFDELPVDLHLALEEAIAMNQPPDLITNVALSLRTIFATIPYFMYDFTGDALPIPFLGDFLYVATNVPAQIVARLTGVTGASIFPLLPPPPPSWPGQDQAPQMITVLTCGSGVGAATEAQCSASVA